MVRKAIHTGRIAGIGLVTEAEAEQDAYLNVNGVMGPMEFYEFACRWDKSSSRLAWEPVNHKNHR